MVENDSGKKLARPFPAFIFLSGYCFLYIEYNLAGELELERIEDGIQMESTETINSCFKVITVAYD
jgi:hypothetical protein